MNESGMSEAEVDETLEASFPASDPPSWTLGISSHSLRELETINARTRISSPLLQR